MLCVNPFRTGKEEFGCGKCLPCKFAKRRTWVGRIVLELQCHAASCFVTLTYSEAPDGYSAEDVRVFFKAVRRRLGSFRYLLVGEKGSRSGRVHYHVALFGVSCARGDEIRACWKWGFVDVGELNAKSGAYLVKYMLKEVKDEKPFRRMSLKPGIGGLVVERLASQVAPLVASGRLDDVPVSLRVGGRQFPMGRYVRSKARIALGMESRTPISVRARQQEEYAVKDPELRERERENSYVSALVRLEILKSKEKLK